MKAKLKVILKVQDWELTENGWNYETFFKERNYTPPGQERLEQYMIGDEL